MCYNLIMSIPTKIIIGISSFAFQKFLDRYGEDILEVATTRGEDFVREYGPQAVRWTADRGNEVYELVAPRAAGVVSKVAVMAGLSAKGVVIPGVDDPENGRLATMLLGPYSGDLSRIGAALRAAAGLGVEQLRNLNDEQLGAVAVALWRMQNRDNVIGRRLRKRFWR
jgi:aminoglycoside/choline kinase family phosphotransferase